MWSVVMWSELTRFYFEVKWSDVSYSEVLGDKSVMYNRVTLYLIILWLFHLGTSCTVCFNLYCVCFNLFCNVCVCVYVCVCVCVCVGVFVICVLVFTVFCIVRSLFFVLFRLCIFILICFVCTSVRTAATDWQLNCS